MAALPIALLVSTVFAAGAVGVSQYFGVTDEEGIVLNSGSIIRVGSQVRIAGASTKKLADTCLAKTTNTEPGLVTSINKDKKLVTVKCVRKNGLKVDTMTVDANDLEVVFGGPQAAGIQIMGGYATEGSIVQLKSSEKSGNSRALASPYYNSTGTVIQVYQKTKQLLVRATPTSNTNMKMEDQIYDGDTLQFVSPPRADRAIGLGNGVIRIGSSVQLVMREDGKTPVKPNGKLADPGYEKIGKVMTVDVDPSDRSKRLVRVKCFGKADTKYSNVNREVVYKEDELEAVPASKIPRTGVPIFGGLAALDVKVKIREERREVLKSKPLGRAAFGDMGTVGEIQKDSPDNLQVYVICNGLNPEEETGDWYEPEDLEMAEIDDKTGTPVFGGQVVVGSFVRVMESAKGRKCLGKSAYGDIGIVRGIDPTAAENLKLKISCGKDANTKQTEWYTPEEVMFYDPESEVGTELDKAKSRLARANDELRTAEQAGDEPAITAAKAKVEKSQKEVDELSGQRVSSQKANEVLSALSRKLADSRKLLQKSRDLREDIARETSCSKSTLSTVQQYINLTNTIIQNWMIANSVPTPDELSVARTKIQGSAVYESAMKKLVRAMNLAKSSGDIPEYLAKTQAENNLKNATTRSSDDPESKFDIADGLLSALAVATRNFKNLPATPEKAKYEAVDEALARFQDVTRDLETAAYAGDTPAEATMREVQETLVLKREELLSLQTQHEEKDAAANDACDEAHVKKAEADRAELVYNAAVKADRGDLNKDDAATQARIVALTAEIDRLSTPGTGATGPAPAQFLTPTMLQNSQEINRLNIEKAGLEKLLESRTTAKKSPTDALKVFMVALRDYVKQQKKCLDERRKERKISSRYGCLQISIDAAEDLIKKLKVEVDGRCGLIDKADEVIGVVETLVDAREKAYTAVQIAVDPTKRSGTFAAPFKGMPVETLIRTFQTLGAQIEQDPTTDRLRELVRMSGTYSNPEYNQDLDALKRHLGMAGGAESYQSYMNDVMSGPWRPYQTNEEEQEVQSPAPAPAREVQPLHTGPMRTGPLRSQSRFVEPEPEEEEGPLPSTSNLIEPEPEEEEGPLPSTSNLIEPAPARVRPPLLTPTELQQGQTTPQARARAPSPTPPTLEQTRAARNNVLNRPAPARVRKPLLTPTMLQRGPTTPPAPAPVADIETSKRLAKALVDTQIRLLQPKMLGAESILAEAQRLSSQADSQVGTAMFKLASVENARANIGKVDVKVGGAIDSFKWDTKAVSQCVIGRDKLADEEYKRDLAKLEEYEKRIESRLEAYKGQQGQQGQQGQKVRAKDIMSVADIETELKIQNLDPSRRAALIKRKNELLANPSLAAPAPAPAVTTPGGGRRRRFTVRRSRRS